MRLINILVTMLLSTVVAASLFAAEKPSSDYLYAALSKQASASIDVSYSHSTGVAIRYIRTPEYLYEEINEPGIGIDIKGYFDLNSNEFLSLRPNDNVGLIDSRLRHPLDMQDVLDPPKFYLYDNKNLKSIIKSGVVGDTMEMIDEANCWRVEIDKPTESISKYVIFLDPEIGYCPRQIEFVWTDREPKVFHFKEYEIVSDGIWYPKLFVIDVPKEGESPATTITYKVTSLTCANIPSKDSMRIKFPQGTTVRLGGTKKEIVVQ